jgi:simple sugar transport system permease protein
VRADQIITGTAMSMLGLGLTGTLYRLAYGSGGAALHTPTAGPRLVPVLNQLPIVGKAFFAQTASTYVLYALVPLLAWWMYRTSAGLSLRAVGESPEASTAAGIAPAHVRAWAILFGGAMGGVSGGTLVLSQVGTFAEGISAGRGFIAIAIVVLGRWTPFGVAGASLLFGGASALQYLSQAMGWAVPYQGSLALPYVLTLVALAGAGSRSPAPAALGAQ